MVNVQDESSELCIHEYRIILMLRRDGVGMGWGWDGDDGWKIGEGMRIYKWWHLGQYGV